MFIIFRKIIFLTLFPLFIHAQQHDMKFERMLPEHGSPQFKIHCIIQDQKGFMWFGTENGLYRYDGYEYKVFKYNPENPYSLSHNDLTAICEDDSGKLWIATEGGGLNKFDPLSEKFTHFVIESDSLSISSIISLCLEKTGMLWIGTTGDGLYKLDIGQLRTIDSDIKNNRFIIEQNLFTHYNCSTGNANSFIYKEIKVIYEDNSGTIWIGTFGGGLYQYNRKNDSFKCFQNNPSDPTSLSNNEVFSILEDQSGNLWIGTNGGGLDKFDRQKEQFIHYRHSRSDPKSLSNNYIRAIFEDEQSGKIWIGTSGGGLNIFDPAKQEFSHYRNEPGNSNSLNGDIVRIILKDNSGVIWIRTEEQGLNKYDKAKEKFMHYKHDPENSNSLSHGPVRSICESSYDGTLWIGTFGGGLNKFDREKGIWTNYQREDGNPNSLSSNTVNCIYEDPDEAGDVLWIGTTGGGLNKFDRKKQQSIRYVSEPGNTKNWTNKTVWTIYESPHDDILWFGTWNGELAKFDREKQQFTWYKHDPENSHSLAYCRAVLAIYEDPDEAGKILWLGTDGGGLNKFDREKKQFIHYKNDPEDPASLSDDRIFTIHKDKSGMLWLSTRSGLNKFDRKTEKFSTYVYDCYVQGILEDDEGNFWLTTNNGLLKFNPQTGTHKRYEVRDGLQSNKFWGAGHRSPKSGEMFVGGVNGFNSFFPDQIKDNPHIPPIVITDFQISNKPVSIGSPFLKKSITETKEIELSYRDRVFSFEFVALHFAIPDKNQYAYKMEGLDEDWNYIGTRRFTTFTNLSPGEYVFRVKGSNCDGIWNEQGTSIKIIITPPWWKTWWAYLIYFILFSGIIYSIIRFSINRSLLKSELALEHKHAEKLEELDRMKSRFFANISHEFRTPLTLILGPLEKLLSETIDKKLTKQYKVMLRSGRRLLRLINQLLDLSKMESGSMSLRTSPENIVKLIRSTVLFFSSMAERRKINLKFSANQDSIEVYVDRDKLEKIISNLLSNAFKFTPERGKISVTVSKSAAENISQAYPMKWSKDWNRDFVEIIVADTGAGIPPDRIDKIFNRFFQVEDASTRTHEGTGIGLALSKELVELHHGEICVASKISDEPDAQGTIFFIRLPLGKAHLKDKEIIEISQTSLIDEKAEIELEKPEFEEITQLTPEIHLKKGIEIILIVEDNQDVRDYIREFLETTYQIAEAKDGVEGFEMATEKIPDLIVSDVMMPKMDGFEFCRLVKTDQRTSHIPVILLTARASGDSKVEGLETGADDYLTKPFDVRELQVRVKNLIEGRRKLRERFSREITLQPKDIAITSMDEQFLQRAMDIIEKHISEPEFTTETLAWEIGMSRMQLNRKLKALTGQPTHSFIRMMRLKRAAQLLEQGAGTVSEIVYDVGFNNLSHFAKVFRQQFGQSPSEFAAKFQH